MTEFKKFKVSKFFDIHPTKSYKLTNRKLMNPNGKSPVLTNTSTNNGIGGWSNLKPTENQLMITFSDTTTGADTMFVQDEPFIGYSHVQGMYPKPDHSWTVTELLYVIVALKASAGDGWSYATKFNRKIVSNLDILLPVTPSGDPDFAYMTRYIQDLEAQRIQDLDAYLKVSGLDNTVLTDQEKAALTKKAEDLSFDRFSLFDLYNHEVRRGTRLTRANRVSGSIPLITAGEANTGVADWIEHNTELFPANSITIDMFGNVFYRDYQFYADDNILVLHNNNFDEKTSLFFVAQLRQALSNRFNYGHQFRQKSLRKVEFALPVKPDRTIDFAYMQDYITALEKLNIKDVVAYKDKVIATTKRIVSQQS